MDPHFKILLARLLGELIVLLEYLKSHLLLDNNMDDDDFSIMI